MINNADFEKITHILDAMIQFELCLSELYETCGRVSKEDETFWQNLSQAEISHSKNIKMMRGLLIEKKERFQVGRPSFNLVALNTAMAGIKDNIKRVSQGEVTQEKTLIMARDIEQSVLESRYAEIIKTDDVEYQTLMRGILTQTNEHRQAIQKAIDDLKNKV